MITHNAVTRIHDKYYDLSKFKHPGGPVAISLTDQRDATGLFVSHHPFVDKSKLESIMKKYETKAPEGVEIEKDTYFDYEKPTPFAQEIVSRCKTYFEGIAKKKGISITAATKATPKRQLENYFYFFLYLYAVYCWFLGEWWTIVGMPFAVWTASIHLFHDATHFAFSRNWFVNYIMPYLLSPLLVSPMDWYHQHSIGHHVHTNVSWKDPDLAHAPVVYRVHSSVKWRKAHIGQAKQKTPWIWALAMPIGLNLISPIRGMLTNLYNRTTPYMPMSRKRWALHILGRFLALSMWVWPYFYFPLWKAVIWTPIPLYQLSVHFMINTQVTHLNHDSTESYSRDWYAHQVLTATDFGHKSLFAWFYSGGLNFQIEHHLFPNVNHCHHQYLQPIIQEVCKKHNVEYKSVTTFYDAIKLHFQHIYNMEKPKAKAE
eukprot:CAMPEP_0115004000 /NCGR_PEP_ID=MMETSP0216-20121206/18947_1 /TAXON_ID=223996 /ORGANISM="Protocruzia adherens, Strain Boccale" /LENGTH=428 /DNA_ID=CAMNT_0002369915 /DNA_START=115 /DNA_END=1401 /DNA_ORIENTATION=+